MKAFLFGVVALLAALPAAAQVGHDPEHSPYRDLEHKQEITWLVGYLRARHDPAGVEPRSAAMTGVRYEINLAGPLGLSVDVMRSVSERTKLDPAKPLATRLVGHGDDPGVCGGPGAGARPHGTQELEPPGAAAARRPWRRAQSRAGRFVRASRSAPPLHSPSAAD